ncbi:Deoxyuridine 5'-triphosphate nucleotidohydrolase [Ceratocystis platani]|uniref:dUTP diphosphatase n=1 Tax=Ceratocystis fimbriata f. sp. platani TaxID=88771 RepID=A0A0F8DEW3_CERFI|nr:Deoxyuridine 5'-triphosphate nucleotidohydrolase [Ceratocystis platani]
MNSEETHERNLKASIRELERAISEEQNELAKLLSDGKGTIPNSQSATETLSILTDAYNKLAESEPYLPFSDSVLPALLALRATHQGVQDTRNYATFQNLAMSEAQRKLDAERANLADLEILSSAFKDRMVSLEGEIAERQGMTYEDVRAEKLANLRTQKKKYDTDVKKLLRGLNSFVEKHLAPMLAAEELGGPVVGEMMQIDPDSLAAGFTAQGRPRKPRVESNIDMRQRRIDDLWGPAQTLERKKSGEWNEAAAAAEGMKHLVERLLNQLVKSGGNGELAYVAVEKDSATARFLLYLLRLSTYAIVMTTDMDTHAIASHFPPAKRARTTDIENKDDNGGIFAEANSGLFVADSEKEGLITKKINKSPEPPATPNSPTDAKSSIPPLQLNTTCCSPHDIDLSPEDASPAANSRNNEYSSSDNESGSDIESVGVTSSPNKAEAEHFELVVEDTKNSPKEGSPEPAKPASLTTGDTNSDLSESTSLVATPVDGPSAVVPEIIEDSFGSGANVDEPAVEAIINLDEAEPTSAAPIISRGFEDTAAENFTENSAKVPTKDALAAKTPTEPVPPVPDTAPKTPPSVHVQAIQQTLSQAGVSTSASKSPITSKIPSTTKKPTIDLILPQPSFETVCELLRTTTDDDSNHADCTVLPSAVDSPAERHVSGLLEFKDSELYYGPPAEPKNACDVAASETHPCVNVISVSAGPANDSGQCSDMEQIDTKGKQSQPQRQCSGDEKKDTPVLLPTRCYKPTKTQDGPTSIDSSSLPTTIYTTNDSTCTDANNTTATSVTAATTAIHQSDSCATVINSFHPATMEVPLYVKKLSDKAKLPVRGSAFAAGYDLSASKDTTIPARGKALVSTDLSIACPAGTYGRIAPRSGLAAKHFIDTGAGVIDADYRGEVKVLLFNHHDADFEVKEGDRIAQLVLERIVTPDVVEVAVLEESVRGAGGFGSTGGFGTTSSA